MPRFVDPCFGQWTVELFPHFDACGHCSSLYVVQIPISRCQIFGRRRGARACPQMELLNCVILFNFLKTAQLFFFIPISNAQGFWFLHILTNNCFCVLFCLFSLKHPEVSCHLTGFNVHFPMMHFSMILNILLYEFTICVFFAELFIALSYFGGFLLGCKSSLCVLVIDSLSAAYLTNNSPILKAPFSLCWLYPLIHESFES